MFFAFALAQRVSLSFTIAVISLSLISCSPQAEEPVGNATATSAFVAGQDYDVISGEPSKQAKIIEHFSLYCGHCYHSEGLFTSLKKQLPAAVAFERSHVLYFPQNNKAFARNMTFAFAAAQELGIEDKFVAKVFDYHFVDKTFLGEVSDLKNIFVVLGHTGDSFDTTLRSDATLERVKGMAAQATTDQVRFTPDLIVNDKYRVKLDKLQQAQDADQRLAQLVNHLLTNP